MKFSLQTMEVKFSVSDLRIGGAKSGINFDPNDPRKGSSYNAGIKQCHLTKKS
jgi:glutamate dehydrogenase/leucine dehydrogenase